MNYRKEVETILDREKKIRKEKKSRVEWTMMDGAQVIDHPVSLAIGARSAISSDKIKDAGVCSVTEYLVKIGWVYKQKRRLCASERALEEKFIERDCDGDLLLTHYGYYDLVTGPTVFPVASLF